jgi:hypothetical protein
MSQPKDYYYQSKGRQSFLFHAARLFHAVSLSWFAYVFFWHWTPAAKILPGAKGFGWFFRCCVLAPFKLPA